MSREGAQAHNADTHPSKPPKFLDLGNEWPDPFFLAELGLGPQMREEKPLEVRVRAGHAVGTLTGSVAHVRAHSGIGCP